jgi:hypothetical protein
MLNQKHHPIDNDGGYSPTQSADLRSHLDYIRQHSDRFWVLPLAMLFATSKDEMRRLFAKQPKAKQA